jgi:predicted RNase H-like HicB family nuclease
MSSTPAVRYPMVVYPDVCTDGSFCYVAEHPDLPGCAAHGNTLTEAKERLVRAREAYIAQLRSEGLPLPQPNAASPTMIEWESEAAPTIEPNSEMQRA